MHLDKNVTAYDMQQIAQGITLEDGDIKADDIQYADPVDKKQVGIEIHSGKNRIVRRIFESLGYKVTARPCAVCRTDQEEPSSW